MIFRFITIENDVIHNLTVNQSAKGRYVEIIMPVFSSLLHAFWYIFTHNSCICGYNILVHSRSLDNNMLFHLVPISN